MYSFVNDYSEGAHERILDALTRTNRNQTCGYGLDEHCENARKQILARLDPPESTVHFLVGGTQVNTVAIAAMLRPHQGALCADTGHINVHESGAIEATGHKCIPLPGVDGKITAAQVTQAFEQHYADDSHEHMVQPGMVYISQPTEVGTVYTKDELMRLYDACHRFGARLYVDGARLGCALTCPACDVTLADLARLTDAFTIGGTKMGALFGEALVLNDPALDTDFRYLIKQRGGMLAKGRLLGVQFEALFTDGLYEDLAAHAVTEAQRLRAAFLAHGFAFLTDSPTNQIFPILPKTLLAKIAERYRYSAWCPVDEAHDAVRFCTSWATDPAEVSAFIAYLDAIA